MTHNQKLICTFDLEGGTLYEKKFYVNTLPLSFTFFISWFLRNFGNFEKFLSFFKGSWSAGYDKSSQ